MSSSKTIVMGLGIASGALLATWLLTGSRKEKTKHFISKKTTNLKEALLPEHTKKKVYDDSEAYYI